MVKEYCELHFNGDSERVRNIVRCLLEFINAHVSIPSTMEDLKLVFSELLHNAIIHGSKKSNEKVVFIRIEIDNGCLRACIQDKGPGFDYTQAIAYAHSDDALLSENGRGMILVCALTDSLYFNEAGNEVIFEKRLENG
ncbi:MAG: ATP-binding protein [Defluviitaleaceae bacterium]|nr:ATP-binding protein [Defluviitaleaceae bacterium]